jgi:ABC-type uncharacterized transport system permease subunit
MNTNSSFVLSVRKWRMLKDKIAQYSMPLGGISIIIAITLIFFYLLYVVLPLFLPILSFSIRHLRTDKTKEELVFIFYIFIVDYYDNSVNYC